MCVDITFTLVLFFSSLCIIAPCLSFHTGSIAPPTTTDAAFYDLQQHKGGFTVSYRSQIISKFYPLEKYHQTDDNFNHYLCFLFFVFFLNLRFNHRWERRRLVLMGSYITRIVEATQLIIYIITCENIYFNNCSWWAHCRAVGGPGCSRPTHESAVRERNFNKV